MKKDKAVKKLREVMHQYELSIVDATGEYPDEDAKVALKDNKEIVEALEIAINALN